MANIESEVLNNLSDNLMKQSSVMKEYLNNQNKNEQKVLDRMTSNSKLDEKMLLLIKEQSTAEGKYKDSVSRLLSEYTTEQNYNADQMKEVNSLLSQSQKIQELSRKETLEQRKKDNKENPLSAFKQSLEDFKETKSVKESGKTLLSGLSQGITLKNITKGLLHGAGVALDAPALNILASEISTSVKEEEELNKQQVDLLDRLSTEQQSDTEKVHEEFVNTNKELIDEMKDTMQDGITPENVNGLIDKLEMIEDNTENTYVDLGAGIENMESELKAQTKIFREQLFMQKDAENDRKAKNSSGVTGVDSDISDIKDNFEDDSSDTNIIGGYSGKDKGTSRTSKAKGKFAKLRGLAKSLGAMSSKMLKLAGPVGLAVGAITSIYSGFQGFADTAKNFDLVESQIATATQKMSSTIGSIVESLSFGLLDEKETAKVIDKSVRGFNTQDNGESLKVVDDLASSNVIKKGSWFEKSSISNWEEIRKLPRGKVRAVYDYADWDTDTRGKLIDILNEKDNEVQPVVQDTPVDYNSISNVSSTPLPTPSKSTQMSQPNITVQPAPVVLPPEKPGSKLAAYPTSDSDTANKILLGGTAL